MAQTRASRPQDDFARRMREPLPFQRREWVTQRIFWALIALILIAAMVGVFGRGPLAHRTTANTSLEVEYDWLTRVHSRSAWTLTPRTPPVDGRYRVALDANWAQHFQIQDINPQPESARLVSGRWEYEFAAAGSDVAIVFHVEPRKIGRLEGSIQLNEEPPLPMSHFVFP